VSRSVANKRPPPSEVEDTKRHFQQEEGNPVNKSMTERGYPTFTPRLDTSSMAWKRKQQYRSQPPPEDQFYYDEEYRELK